jgi:opacity protein-like surface antigen
MMRRWMFVAMCLGILAPRAPLPAQRPVWLGLGGGVSFPQGDLGDGANTGWHALATLMVSTLTQPLGLRVDVAYNRFGLKDTDGHEAIGSATLNGTYRLPMTNSPMSPYLIAGLGAYRSECSLAVGCDATTRFGWNVGLGTKLYALGFRSFLEARYHRTKSGDTHLNYFPLTFGLTF